MRSHSILLINPNTTQSMTDALKPLVDSLGFNNTKYTYFTAPSGVPSINNERDAAVSTAACIPALLAHERALIAAHDGFLVCCFSPHPLVGALRREIASRSDEGSSSSPQPQKVVAGIMEAAIAACLVHLGGEGRFAIVSTGAQWKGILDDAVGGFLGAGAGAGAGGGGNSAANGGRYAGTQTTGLDADELHGTSKEVVEGKMKEATRRALREESGVRAICLGCAGMVGMDATVREACGEELGDDAGRRIRIVDGVVSGVAFLEGVLRAG